jgi:hypothetical protein
VNATGAGILSGGGFTLASFADAPLCTWLEASPVPSHPHRRTVAPSHPRTLAPLNHLDIHLLSTQMTPFEQPGGAPAAHRTPYQQLPRSARVERTKALRAQRSSDIERWSDRDNIGGEQNWRTVTVARFIPPGTRVLDLGAGREGLEGLLPEGCTYTPADLAKHSNRTVVVDLNRGELPGGTFDVAVATAVLNYIHDVRALLALAHERVPLFLITYCGRRGRTLLPRLERGWVSDLSISELINLCHDVGWQVAAARQLELTPAFDHRFFALRR